MNNKLAKDIYDEELILLLAGNLLNNIFFHEYRN